MLCDLQELSYAEAAAASGCAVGTVRSRLHRGRALLAVKLTASVRTAGDQEVGRRDASGAVSNISRTLRSVRNLA